MAVNLSVKYNIMYNIGLANQASSYNVSSITPSLVRLLYEVGTRDAFDFGDYIFEQFVKHGESYVIKFPIGLPS